MDEFLTAWTHWFDSHVATLRYTFLMSPGLCSDLMAFCIQDWYLLSLNTSCLWTSEPRSTSSSLNSSELLFLSVSPAICQQMNSFLTGRTQQVCYVASKMFFFLWLPVAVILEWSSLYVFTDCTWPIKLTLILVKIALNALGDVFALEMIFHWGPSCCELHIIAVFGWHKLTGNQPRGTHYSTFLLIWFKRIIFLIDKVGWQIFAPCTFWCSGGCFKLLYN